MSDPAQKSATKKAKLKVEGTTFLQVGGTSEQRSKKTGKRLS
jgi:hypothetical protein